MDELQPKCKFCGEDFTPYRPWQEFCCPEHRSLFYSRYVRNSCGEAVHLLDSILEGMNSLEDIVNSMPPDDQVNEDGKREKSREGGV